jgi:IS1 family transposase
MLDRLKLLEVRCFLLIIGAYAELIPRELLVQTKAKTHGVERNNFRQRLGAVVFVGKLYGF